MKQFQLMSYSIRPHLGFVYNLRRGSSFVEIFLHGFGRLVISTLRYGLPELNQ
jgi:predicted component of type VI protein secretion system